MSLRMIQCGRQTVDVIQPNGQVRQMMLPLKVSDLLMLYPHHFVAHAGTTKRGSMLPLETQLETGNSYVLLPLPRIFPSSSSSSLSPLDAAPPPPCSCFLQMQQQGSSITSRMMSSMIMIMGGSDPADLSADGTSKPKLKQRIKAALTSLQQPSSSKISPDESSCSSSSSSSSSSLFGGRDKVACHPRRLWEPALDVIMEDKVLMRTKEEEAQAIRSKKEKKKAPLRPEQTSESSIVCREGRMFG
ncbi:hypothetical protein EJ110_NYTH59362 [Nymphaea thermarum]|nr:hypothetical protein EJ110_NYTH59362 [Nymphaea thermarum]